MGYFKTVRQELGKVTWPSGREVTGYTWVVILSIVLFGLYFGGIDLGLSELIQRLFAL